MATTTISTTPPTALDLTRDEKVKLAVVSAAALAIVGVAIYMRNSGPVFTASSKPPDYGIKINPTCSEWTVTDKARLDATFGVELNDAIARGDLDPHKITAKFLSKISKGKCRSYPGDTRSPAEALLYYTVLQDVATVLLERNQISEAIFDATILETEAWAIRQGVDREDLDDFEDIIDEGLVSAA